MVSFRLDACLAIVHYFDEVALHGLPNIVTQ